MKRLISSQNGPERCFIPVNVLQSVIVLKVSTVRHTAYLFTLKFETVDFIFVLFDLPVVVICILSIYYFFVTCVAQNCSHALNLCSRVTETDD